MADILGLRQAVDTLHEHQELFQVVFRHAPFGAALLDMDGYPIMTNHALQTMLGYTDKQFRTMCFTDYTHPDDSGAEWGLFTELVAGKRDHYRMEKRYIHCDGHMVWGSLAVTLVRDSEGRPHRIVKMVEDITERKATEELREATIELLRLCNNANTVHALMRELMRFFQKLTTCEAVGVRLQEGDDYPYYEMRGFSEDFIRTESRLCAIDQEGMIVRDQEGKPVLECLCGGVLSGRLDDSRPFMTRYGSFWTNNSSQLPADMAEANRQVRMRNRCIIDGYESVALIPLRLHGNTFGLFQFNDRRPGLFSPERVERLENLVEYMSIALSKLRAEEESRRLNNELHTSNQAIRNISMHLETLRENERKAIAREIHDEFGQSLTALKFHIAWLRNNITSAGENQLSTQLANMEQIIESGMDKLQKISSNLRPEILDDLGLVATIEWQAGELRQLSGITFDLDLPKAPLPPLSPEISITVFRILQESLTNIMRHSGATRVEISLHYRNKRLYLRIADNGRGITDDELSSPTSLGIHGMTERALSCPEGALEIKRGADNGTVLELSLSTVESKGIHNASQHEVSP
jgi:PAS domain S-box-containing protein